MLAVEKKVLTFYLNIVSAIQMIIDTPRDPSVY